MPEEYYKHMLDFWKYNLSNSDFNTYERLRQVNWLNQWYDNINDNSETQKLYSKNTYKEKFITLICIFITMNNRLLKKIPDVRL